ncbi:MAG: hypothetical protein QXP98_06030 [Thermoproteus sp.]
MLQHAEREVLKSLRALAERLRQMGVEGGMGEVSKRGNAASTAST